MEFVVANMQAGREVTHEAMAVGVGDAPIMTDEEDGEGWSLWEKQDLAIPCSTSLPSSLPLIFVICSFWIIPSPKTVVSIADIIHGKAFATL